MNDRRKFIAGISGVALTPVLAAAATSAAVPAITAPICTETGAVLPVSDDQNAFPELAVVTQRGQSLMLYSALVKGRVVVMNFMSIANEAAFPVTARIAAIVRGLGERIGQDVAIISVTTDPARDTPARLAAFAQRFDAPPAWHFVHADRAATEVLSRRLYRMERDLSQPFSVDLIHYGNARVGLWGSFPTTIQAEDAVRRIASVIGRAVPPGPPRKAGPRPLGGHGPEMNHLIVSSI